MSANQAKKLFQYAKSLEIVEQVEKNKTTFILNFKWNNTDEAREILKDTINLTLKNLEQK